jgi:hypothetical protein
VIIMKSGEHFWFLLFSDQTWRNCDPVFWLCHDGVAHGTEWTAVMCILRCRSSTAERLLKRNSTVIVSFCAISSKHMWLFVRYQNGFSARYVRRFSRGLFSWWWRSVLRNRQTGQWLFVGPWIYAGIKSVTKLHEQGPAFPRLFGRHPVSVHVSFITNF